MLAALLAILCQASPGQAEPQKPTELVFVGTQHFITDMPAGYTPGHLRALLAKIRPDAVAVEAPAGAKNPWDFAPLELQWVTRPWAEERKIPLIPIGWNDPFYPARIQNMMAVLQKAGKGGEMQILEARFQGELARSTSCEEFNGEKGIDLWRKYHQALHDALGKATPWEDWNAKILENLRAILQTHRGKRVAVVFGAAHGYYLLDALAKDEAVKVLPAASFFPLSEEEIRGQTVTRDHLLALRLLNFGAVAPEKLEDLGRHLDALREAKEFRGDFELCTGKFLLHRGDPAGAVPHFDAAAGLPDAEISKFDGTSRLNEAGAVYAAIALGRQGKAAEAGERLRTLLKKEDLALPMKQWAGQVLKEVDPPK